MRRRAAAMMLIAMGLLMAPVGVQAADNTVELHLDYVWPGVGLQYTKDGGDVWSLSAHAASLMIHLNADTATGDGIELVGRYAIPTHHVSEPTGVLAPVIFCLQVDAPRPSSGNAGMTWIPYEVTTLDQMGLNDRQIDDINKLWAGYSSYLNSDSYYDRNLYTGLFQACLWEIVEETSGEYSLSDGTFQVRPLMNAPRYASRESEFNYDRAAFDELGNAWLSSLSTMPSVDFGLSMLWHDTLQNLLVGSPAVGQIPEPLTMSGVALALISLGAYLRKRRKAANSQ